MKDMNNLPRAIECYKTALQINPKFSRALNNLAVVYTIQGKVYIFSLYLFISHQFPSSYSLPLLLPHSSRRPFTMLNYLFLSILTMLKPIIIWEFCIEMRGE